MIKIIIDNLTETEVYFEKQILLNITCNSNTNSFGILETDDNENALVSIVDIGDATLYKLKDYNGDDGVIFYNEINKNIKLVYNNDIIDIPLDFSKGMKYFVGATKIFGKYKGNYSFSADIVGRNIFKIFLDNGREIKTFSINEDSIDILGLDRLYIDEFSELIIYVYKYSNIPLDNEVDYSFQVEYYGYEHILQIDSFLSGTYFDTFTGQEMICFENMEISQTVTQDTEKNNFKNASTSKINRIDNSIEFNIFNASDTIDIIQYIGSDEFRLILVNSIFGRIVLVNNCRINNAVSLIFEKEKNSKRFTLSCGNYIDINLSNPSEYGKNRYGRGLYGSGIQIWNSSKRGVK